jgi:hypothetical protein
MQLMYTYLAHHFMQRAGRLAEVPALPGGGGGGGGCGSGSGKQQSQSQQQLPARPILDAYPVEEKGGMVWLFFGSR